MTVLQSRRLLLLVLLVFVTTLAVRTTALYYGRAEAAKVQTGVTAGYQQLSRILVSEGITNYWSAGSAASNPDLFGHPPGYSFLLALLSLIGESDIGVLWFQLVAEAFAAVMLFLIAARLISPSVGFIAGMLAALSPQFSWNSIVLLPDSLSVLPILLAIFLLARDRNGTRLWPYLLAGVFVGVSCWLRANNLLLAPFLSLLIVLGAFPRPDERLARMKRLKLAGVLVAGAVLVIAPLTLRNAIVYRAFVPLSLGAGQTLLEGIADYDHADRFNMPETDHGIAEMEAREHGRPDYANTLFGPDGLARDRERVSRGLRIIRSHPFWFASVMIRRAVSMLRFERVPLISLDPEHKLAYPWWLRLLQRVFLTTFMLPLTLGGVAVLMIKRRWFELALLLAVPFYYFCVQSALHTEYRYILALHYFLLVLVATALDYVVRRVAGRLIP